MGQIVLGIDPGLKCTGYAVLDNNGTSSILQEAGIFTTSDNETLEQRLKSIHRSIEEVISEFHPGAVVVEKLYSHYDHPQTAVIMGHARGIIFLCAAAHDIPVISYASTRIKKSVTGNGHAPKGQVQRSIQSIMKLGKMPEPPDVADAIAVALCHIGARR